MSRPASASVLAAIDRARDRVAEGTAAAHELASARAAVARLIRHERILREALQDVQEQCRANVKLGAMGPGYWSDLQETADAALSQLGG